MKYERRRPRKTSIRHSMQPVIWDGKGVIRFQENPIVSYLLNWAQNNGLGLNELAALSASEVWTKNDWEHFAQLHGYSVSGWGSLSYVRETTYERADYKRARLLDNYPSDPALSPNEGEGTE